MRYITVCENAGEHKLKGIEHKMVLYRMLPGTAWRIDDESREHHVVQIKDASKAKYEYSLRWIDGRTVAVFLGPDGKEYAQPTTEDERAKDRRLGSIRKVRKLRKPRREATGVAPEAPGSMNAEDAGPTPRDAPGERTEARTSYGRVPRAKRGVRYEPL